MYLLSKKGFGESRCHKAILLQTDSGTTIPHLLKPETNQQNTHGGNTTKKNKQSEQQKKKKSAITKKKNREKLRGNGNHLLGEKRREVSGMNETFGFELLGI